MNKKNKLKAFILAACVFLSMAIITKTDPIDELLKSTTDSKLKEKIRIFRKNGYEKSLHLKTHDAEAIIKSAKSYLGTPHQMGGLTKEGMDCSGLVMITHQQNQVSIPRDANEQARYGKIILSVKELKRGDLVFFHSTYNTSKLVTHSGIYLGKNQFIHVSSKKGVSIASIQSKYWSGYFLFGTSL